MSAFGWLASYPKSGNTWFRMVIGNLNNPDKTPIDINKLRETGGMASSRRPLDERTMVETGLLTHDECDRLRPAFYRDKAQTPHDEHFARAMTCSDQDVPREPVLALVKTHDAWTFLGDGQALLDGADAALLIVRDPRDVAPSLANHMGISIDRAIRAMADPDFALCSGIDRQFTQVRQRLCGWSGFNAGWLDQDQIPVCCLRYEDMKADPFAAISAALAAVGRKFDHEHLRRAIDLCRFDRLARQEKASGFREAAPGRIFFRAGMAGGWRTELTGEQVYAIERDHGEMMERLGYRRSCAQPVDEMMGIMKGGYDDNHSQDQRLA